MYNEIREDVSLYQDLSDQIALVTGANRGIGASIASQLNELNATVYAGSRDTGDVLHDCVHPLEMDIDKPDQIRTAIEKIKNKEGKLDILVNNAGIFRRSDPLHEMKIKDFDDTIRTNFRGTVIVTKFALPMLTSQDGGRVVTVSGSLGQFANGQMGSDYPAYRLSKVGVHGLTTYLSAEYENNGLIANAVCPGWVRTDMGGKDAPRSTVKGAETPVWLCRFAPGSPSGLLWKNKSQIQW